ncbi:mercuric transporter MerT family protein [Bosea sp. LjRoot90]|uniref:mercuric transporter MerT family protein n=1 Tax=Bosea sp. LjRoot90 TaxID=3342342 RepID=UPI003ECFD0D4
MARYEPLVAPTATDDPPSTGPASGGGLAVISVVTGLGAIAASSCCAVPLTLALFGAGTGISGTFEALAPWRIPLLMASTLGVAAGWFASWRKTRMACGSGSACAARPYSRAAFALLLFATLIVVTAISWDYLEPSLLKLVRSA